MHNYLRPKRRNPIRKPVTVIIGIICKAAIVLASDSQTTFGDDSKRCDSEKIRVVKFNNDKVLVAQSGTVETSSRIIDVMALLAADRELENQETVIKTMQEAMHKVREELRYQHFNCSADEFRKIVFDEGLNCGLMVAHFFKDNAFIHTFDFKSGTTTTSKSYYESTGCGSALANYLLAELSSSQMDYRHAQASAIYVVDKVIRHVAYCDRPIRLALIYPWRAGYVGNVIQPPDGKTRLPPVFIDSVKVLTDKEVEEIASKVSKIDEETKFQRAEKLKSALFSFADTLPNLPNYSAPDLNYLKMPEDPYDDSDEKK